MHEIQTYTCSRGGSVGSFIRMDQTIMYVSTYVLRCGGWVDYEMRRAGRSDVYTG